MENNVIKEFIILLCVTKYLCWISRKFDQKNSFSLFTLLGKWTLKNWLTIVAYDTLQIATDWRKFYENWSSIVSEFTPDNHRVHSFTYIKRLLLLLKKIYIIIIILYVHIYIYL